jgi:hypothetical protein
MMAKRSRVGERSLKRRVATRKPRKTLVIFCEGQRTEPEYLNALKRQPSVRDVAAVELRVETGQGGSVPRTLVSIAADYRRRSIAEEGEVDEFWCVFDVEWPLNHPGLDAAIDQARQNDIQLAVSNPCFELWLVLHFQDHAAWLDNAGVRKLLRTLDGTGSKGVDPAKYMPRIAEASRRAAELDKQHRANGTRFPHDNPSSGMHRLMASIEPPEAPN